MSDHRCAAAIQHPMRPGLIRCWLRAGHAGDHSNGVVWRSDEVECVWLYDTEEQER